MNKIYFVNVYERRNVNLKGDNGAANLGKYCAGVWWGRDEEKLLGGYEVWLAFGVV